MSVGTVIKVRRAGEEVEERSRVEVRSGPDPEIRYERLMEQVLRMGAWLTGERAQLLPQEQWEALFERYQEELDELRRLGDELRPVSLRDRHETLSGEALVRDTLELFAA